MPENFQQLLAQLGLDNKYNETITVVISLVCLVLVGYVLYLLAKWFIMPLVRNTLTHYKPEFAASIQVPLHRMTDRLALLAPVVFYLSTFSWFVQPQLMMFGFVNTVFFVYFYINVALILTSALNIGAVIYNLQSYAKEVPIKGIIQIIKLAVFIVFAVLTIAELIGKTPLYLLSSLGALTAVLLLIFKDTLLGLVAGIQIATHRLVAHGDWIEMPQYGADGEVLEVGLHTVKVHNWDKTYTNIPTYKLISETFKNWRGMSQSGGRRIKRALYLDINSIGFIDPQQTKDSLALLNNAAFSKWVVDKDPCETNLGLFRLYCEYYLIHNAWVNQEMTLMARQLQPSEHGIGVEIYCFALDKRWVYYEQHQAQITEHLLASIAVFGLRPFQRPIGTDFQ